MKQTLNLRLLLVALALLVMHSLWLWWSLIPSATVGREPAGSGASALQLTSTLPEQPGGDLFVVGRQRHDDASGEPVTEPEVSAAPFTLLAVLAVGPQHYALFSNGTEQLKLAPGDTLPGRGRISHIEQHVVTVAGEQGENERFLLFPSQLDTPQGGEVGN